jgi:hypothetical protein
VTPKSWRSLELQAEMTQTLKRSFLLESLDIDIVLQDLSDSGATAFKILTEDVRRSLLREAKQYTYRPEAEIVGSGDRIVRQQVASFEDIPEYSQFILLKNSVQAWLDDWFDHSGISPFQTPLSFTSLVLQKYAKGSLGITPHRDHLRFINLICIFVIGGLGRFYVCSDRSGRDAKEIDASPGNVILLRAPGFLGSRGRPFHYVTDIQETRYTLALRQEQEGIKAGTPGSDPLAHRMKAGDRGLDPVPGPAS